MFVKESKDMEQKKSSSIKFFINFVVIFLLIFFIILFTRIFNKEQNAVSKLAYMNSDSNNNLYQEEIEENIIPPENIVILENPKDITINMSVIGDIMCHNSQYVDAYDYSTGEYDFSYVFEDIKKYLQDTDITIGNIETTFAGKEVGYSNYPNFNTPEALAYNLKDLGIDVVSTANNHSLDKGYEGLESTINFLDDAGILHTGTFKSQQEKDTILIKEVNGLNIAFLSYTYGTNGMAIPAGKEYCINLIDKDLILKQLELAKDQNPDLICVIMHWGTEYEIKQNNVQEDLANFLFENGVDIILGGHPHVLQPMEKRTITLDDNTTKECFVIYSLGNFMSAQTQENTRDTVILNLQITKRGRDGKITINEVKYVPLYMYKKPSGTKKYKLLDIEKCIANYEQGIDTSIGQNTYNTLIKSLEKIKSILGEEI